MGVSGASVAREGFIMRRTASRRLIALTLLIAFAATLAVAGVVALSMPASASRRIRDRTTSTSCPPRHRRRSCRSSGTGRYEQRKPRRSGTFCRGPGRNRTSDRRIISRLLGRVGSTAETIGAALRRRRTFPPHAARGVPVEHTRPDHRTRCTLWDYAPRKTTRRLTQPDVRTPSP